MLCSCDSEAVLVCEMVMLGRLAMMWSLELRRSSLEAVAQRASSNLLGTDDGSLQDFHVDVAMDCFETYMQSYLVILCL